MHIINIGFGSMVFAERIVGVLSPDSSPIKRLMREASERGRLIDASFGRRTRSVIITDSDHIILSSLTPEALASRMSGESEGIEHETDR